MAEDGPQLETETGRLLPEGSRLVPLSSRSGLICAPRPLSTPLEGPVAETVEGSEGK